MSDVKVQENSKDEGTRISPPPPIWARLARRGLDLLYPPTCFGCGTMIADHPGLCVVCWRDLKFITKPYCPVLGLPFEVDLGEGTLSAQAIANPPDFDRARSAVGYTDVARKLVTRFKFGGQTHMAAFMAQHMVRAGDDLLQSDGLIVPVPLHRKRQMGRRFNQSGLLSAHIARLTGLHVRYDLLKRIKPTQQQVGLTSAQRKKNVIGAFKVEKENISAVFGKKVILVDDVITTGATANAAARALKQAGATDVSILSFARVLAPE